MDSHCHSRVFKRDEFALELTRVRSSRDDDHGCTGRWDRAHDQVIGRAMDLAYPECAMAESRRI